MKKLLIAALVSAGMILASAAANATVINFDELDTKGSRVALNTFTKYAGFDWHKDIFVAVNTLSGYTNAAHSGTNFLLNGRGVDIDVSNTTAFDFAGAWFAIPTSNGSKASWVNITAFDADKKQIGTTGNVAVTNNFAYIAANFADVTRLTITRDKGWFVMDDFTLTDAEVPEPGTLFMFGLGIAALLGTRRNKA